MMTDRQLKHALKSAYQIQPSEQGRAFLRRYEKRSLQMHAVIKTELRYMGMKSLLAGVFLCAILFCVARQGDIRVQWTASSVLPLFALVLSAIVGKSERYGMEELEASSRFSLRFVRLIRMLIVGVLSCAVIFILAGILRKLSGFGSMMTVCFVGFPYLLNVWGSLLITRKWHAKDNIYGCVGMTICSCLLPFFAKFTELWSYIDMRMIYPAMFLLLMLTIRESILYVKEGGDLTWNLC